LGPRGHVGDYYRGDAIVSWPVSRDRIRGDALTGCALSARLLRRKSDRDPAPWLRPLRRISRRTPGRDIHVVHLTGRMREHAGVPLPRSGPIQELDLRAAVEQLVAATPGIVSVHLFGSRVHRTQSLRSDIDLLVSGQGLSPAKMNFLQARISAYLDVFVVAGATAISAANQSTIPAATTSELYEKTSAEELWRGEWVGAEDLVTQDILRNYAPVPTFALVGAEHLAVDAVDYLFVTALPMEYQAVVDAVGDMTVGDGEGRLVRHHVGTIGPSEKTVAVVLLPTIGMVAAALTTQQLVGSMDVGIVLLVGITGAIQEDGVNLGDLVIPRNLFDYEAAKATAVGDRLNPTIVPVPRPLYQRGRTPFIGPPAVRAGGW
jgi:predicted nucleotidyltransferase